MSSECLAHVERWRIRSGNMASTETDGWNGAFLVPLEGQMWHVIISDQLGWKHLSVTNAQKKMTPDWSVMCRLKELFFGPDVWAVQFHPPKDDYINDHPYCLHLWSPLDEPLPRPSFIFV